MITIVCVLKTGVFDKHEHANKEAAVCSLHAGHVQFLYRQCLRKIERPFRFVCLTNLDFIHGIETIKLSHNWQGWWSKLELFKKGQFSKDEKIIYIDLDTAILGNIDDILDYDHKFTTLDNISHPRSGDIGSGIMAWKGDYSYLYETFKEKPNFYMQDCVTSRNWGDQGFIKNHLGFEPEKFQFLFSGIYSHRKDFIDKKPLPYTRIAIFNGDPKPWDLDVDWLKH